MAVRRPQVDHYEVAAALRESPGEWDLVKVYAARYSAWNTRNRILRGIVPAYLDGQYEVKVAPDPEGWALWAKFKGERDG